MISIKSTREIEIMKETCSLAASVLEYIRPKVVSGVTTLELNDLCHQYIVAHGATPSPLNYHGFPKSICTSKNEVICHGIPSNKVGIREGDILNIDITTYYKGFHGDTNMTFCVGQVRPEVQRLVDVTYYCLREGIKTVRPGGHVGDIGAQIEEIAHAYNYSVVQEYCGHGIGRQFHEEPQILHFGKKGTGPELRTGMTFTIEPMINMGARDCKVLSDNWTVVTKDGKWSAQFEHTLMVTESGVEILTLRTDEEQNFTSIPK